jgi:transposase
MLVVETIAKIRRAYFQDKKPIKQICRELRVSRKTVRKVVRSGATEFTYERSVQPQPKIGPWRDELDRMLAENARKPKRDRLTAIRIFEELQTLGYEGGYDAVRRYAAAWSKAESAASAAAFVPLSFDPGEAYQFDWSHEIVLIDGVTTTVKVAHVRLCHSRMVFVRAYPRETQEIVARHRSWDRATSQVVDGDDRDGAARGRRDQVSMSLSGVVVSFSLGVSVSRWLSPSMSLSDVAVV